ncbi:uncharacterized protein [Anomalospiza imberbis]|uniref:uncharacterized protein n=1 Tax=Anomalospiza imberbis TaxID=187417 RepID=UPI00358EDE86
MPGETSPHTCRGGAVCRGPRAGVAAGVLLLPRVELALLLHSTPGLSLLLPAPPHPPAGAGRGAHRVPSPPAALLLRPPGQALLLPDLGAVLLHPSHRAPRPPRPGAAARRRLLRAPRPPPRPRRPPLPGPPRLRARLGAAEGGDEPGPLAPLLQARPLAQRHPVPPARPPAAPRFPAAGHQLLAAGQRPQPRLLHAASEAALLLHPRGHPAALRHRRAQPPTLRHPRRPARPLPPDGARGAGPTPAPHAGEALPAPRPWSSGSATPSSPPAPPPAPAAAAASPDGPRPAPGPALKGAAPPLYVTARVRTDSRTSGWMDGWMSTGMGARTDRLTAEQRQAPAPIRCTGDASCPALPKSLLPGQEHMEVKPRQIREAFPKRQPEAAGSTRARAD